MARIANTYLTTSSAVKRESIDDVVSRITPEDTPIYSMIKKTKASSIHPEWPVDELDAPGDNAHPEGDEFNFDSITPVKRMGNYTQIFRKSWIVSASQEAVDTVGNVEKSKEQKLKAGVCIRKDIEFMIVSNFASMDGAKRRSGSLASFYQSNVTRGAGGANGGYNSSTSKTVRATDGKQRPFSKDLLDETLQKAYTNGANVRSIIVSPYVKSVFATFMSDSNVAQFRYAADKSDKNVIVATADVYLGSHGKVTIIPNRIMSTPSTARNAHLLDTSLVEMRMLRKLRNESDLAKTGDAKKGVIIGEGALCVKNEKGLGVIADIFGLSPTS